MTADVARARWRSTTIVICGALLAFIGMTWDNTPRLDQPASSGLEGRWILSEFHKSGERVDIPKTDFVLTSGTEYVTWQPWTPGVLDGRVGLKFSYTTGAKGKMQYMRLTREYLIDDGDDFTEVDYYYAYAIAGETLTLTQDGKAADELPSRQVTTKGDSLWTAVYLRKP